MMKKNLWRYIPLFLLLSASSSWGTTLSDTLAKRFQTTDYPSQEVVARISLHTEVPEIEGDRMDSSVLLAYKTQAKLVEVFMRNGWRRDLDLLTDIVDAGLIELQIDKGMDLRFKDTFRLKAFVHQCDMPMFKYRGGDLEEFFQKQVLQNAEQCFTYDERLENVRRRD